MGAGAMTDTAKPQGNSGSGRSAYRKVWWLRFLLPPIAVAAWWYFAGTAVSAYQVATEGVVVPGEITATDTGRRTDYMTLRFTTSDGRRVETTVAAPKSCDLKRPGDTIKVRYLPSDPYTAQDTCDPARHHTSWVALLGALATTALSAQAWRLWLRHRKAGKLPPEYPV